MNGPREPYSLRGLLTYFAGLGATGFGGPVALATHMEVDLVERRGWITKEQYVEGLALAQLCPGPLATQLAIYLGWVRSGVLGATLVALAFLIPPFLICLALAVLYVKMGGLPWIQGAFYAVGAAVVGIIVKHSYSLIRSIAGRDRLLLAIAAASGLFTAVTESEPLWIFLGGGALSLFVKAPPRIGRSRAAAFFAVPDVLLTGIQGVAASGTLGDIAAYFTKAGAVVFGSGLAIVPFLHAGVVDQYHWLTERQFIDAVAVSMITPGPIVITVAFIGYLTAGYAGAVVAAIGTFLPCYLFTVLPAPYYSRFAKHRGIHAFVQGVTAAAVGAIAGATWILGKRAITDLPTIVIAGAALALGIKAKVPDPLLILAAGVTGVLLRTF